MGTTLVHTLPACHPLRGVTERSLVRLGSALQVVGRGLLVVSLLPIALPALGGPLSRGTGRPLSMEASNGQHDLPAEPQTARSVQPVQSPLSRPTQRTRIPAELGRVPARPGISTELLAQSHVPEEGRGAPDPPHLPPAPWRAPPRLPR